MWRWGRRAAVPDHEHAILDEEVFHAYQELAVAVEMMLDPNLDGGQRLVESAQIRLNAALDRTVEHRELDPYHHMTVGRERGLSRTATEYDDMVLGHLTAYMYEYSNTDDLPKVRHSLLMHGYSADDFGETEPWIPGVAAE